MFQFVVFDVLAEMLGDDEETIKMMLRDFVEPLSESLREIQLCCKRRNSEELKMAAHKLKSSALVIGASDLAIIGQSLETAGDEDNWSTVNEDILNLVQSMTKTIDYIEKL